MWPNSQNCECREGRAGLGARQPGEGGEVGRRRQPNERCWLKKERVGAGGRASAAGARKRACAEARRGLGAGGHRQGGARGMCATRRRACPQWGQRRTSGGGAGFAAGAGAASKVATPSKCPLAAGLSQSRDCGTYAVKTFGQDVLEKAAQKLLAAQRAGALLARAGVAIAKGDGALVLAQQARAGERRFIDSVVMDFFILASLHRPVPKRTGRSSPPRQRLSSTRRGSERLRAVTACASRCANPPATDL